MVGGDEVGRVVPWSSDAEWKLVLDLLFSDNGSQQQLGVHMVHMWQIRCAGDFKLSVTIELTALLVSSRLHFLSAAAAAAAAAVGTVSGGHHIDYTTKSLVLSAALIRFVSLLSEGERIGGARSAAAVCADFGVPVWISELRNDSAHSSIPPADVLLNAVNFCLQFLKAQYWDRHWSIVYNVEHQTAAVISKHTEDYLRAYANNPSSNLKHQYYQVVMKCYKKGEVTDEAFARHVCEAVVESRDILVCAAFDSGREKSFLDPLVDFFGSDVLRYLCSVDSNMIEEALGSCLNILLPKLRASLSTDQIAEMIYSCMRHPSRAVFDAFNSNFDLHSSRVITDTSLLQLLSAYSNYRACSTTDSEKLEETLAELETFSASGRANTLTNCERRQSTRAKLVDATHVDFRTLLSTLVPDFESSLIR